MKIALLSILISLSGLGLAQDTEKHLKEVYKKLDRLEKAKSNDEKIKPNSTIEPLGEINAESKEMSTLKVSPVSSDQILASDSNRNSPLDSLEGETLKAKIEFDTATFNTGTITQGDLYKHTFHFRNTGTANLELFDVVPDCSCTSPKFTKGTIEPGESGTITIAYDTKEDIGDFIKTITVLHSAGEGFSFLELRGFVAPKL